jgi:hypothetical protein
MAPDEEKYFAQIERALGRRLDRSKTPELPPRDTVTVPATQARRPGAPHGAARPPQRQQRRRTA